MSCADRGRTALGGKKRKIHVLVFQQDLAGVGRFNEAESPLFQCCCFTTRGGRAVVSVQRPLAKILQYLAARRDDAYRLVSAAIKDWKADQSTVHSFVLISQISFPWLNYYRALLSGVWVSETEREMWMKYFPFLDFSLLFWEMSVLAMCKLWFVRWELRNLIVSSTCQHISAGCNTLQSS